MYKIKPLILRNGKRRLYHCFVFAPDFLVELGLWQPELRYTRRYLTSRIGPLTLFCIFEESQRILSATQKRRIMEHCLSNDTILSYFLFSKALLLHAGQTANNEH